MTPHQIDGCKYILPLHRLSVCWSFLWLCRRFLIWYSMSMKFCPMFSSWSFAFSGLVLNPFWVNSCEERNTEFQFHSCIWISSFQYYLLKKLSFSSVASGLPCQIMCSYRWGFISGVSILFHWLMVFFFFKCHYHTVLIAITLEFSLIPGSVMPPALFFFLRMLWLFEVLWGSIYTLGLYFLFLWKMSLEFW